MTGRMPRRAIRPTLLILSVCLSQVALAQGAPGVLDSLRVYLRDFRPEQAETSLLQVVVKAGMDWTAAQNAFAVQFNDPQGRFLEWRGHSLTAGSNVFTTLRAATYEQGSRALLLVNREWCAAGRCQVRNAFAWADGTALQATPETRVIPLLRDQDFYANAVPTCLRGVSLGVSYVPDARALAVNAMAVIPPAAAARCQGAGQSVDGVTVPVRLNWNVPTGTFRRAR